MVAVLRYVLLLIGLLALAPIPGRAQGSVSISSLEIDFWPEYDRPEMLVIYKVILSPEVSLPAEVGIRIPTRVGEPNAVAERQMTGQGGSNLFNVAYNRQVQGEWALITYTATMPESQIEFYDPQLNRDGSARYYEYEWDSDYRVDSLVLQVQQPADASDLRIDPALGAANQGSDGLLYYSAQLGSLQPGETLRLTLDYQKGSDALSVQLRDLAVQPSYPITGETSGRTNVSLTLTWVLGALGVLLIGSGLWWYRQLGREKSRPALRRRRRAAPPEMEEVDEEDGVYCHQCGRRGAAGDRFCRACGTRLRV